MLPNLKAVFFDFDGLILDTEWPEVEAWQTLFSRHGQSFPDEIWIGSIGRGAEQEHQDPAALLSKLTGQPAEAINAAHRRMRIDLLANQPLRSGVRERLEEARALGLIIAVVSSSGHRWVEDYLKALGIHGFFDRFFCSEDVVRTKPAPDLYLLALASFGLQPREVVVFEDSPNGITAAQAAGIYAIAVPNRLTAQLDLSHADEIRDSLNSISLTGLIGKVPTVD